MLSRSVGKSRGVWGFQSLPYRRPFLKYPYAILLPRYQVNWKSDKPKAFDGDKSEHTRRQKKPQEGDGDAKVTLDVDSLGKPGQIVVVAGRRRQMSNRRNRKPQTQSRDTISAMLGDLEIESSTLSDTSVQDSINETRGTYRIKETLPESDFKAMLCKLASSFTHKQLSDYILKHYRELGDIGEKKWTWGPQAKAKGSGNEETKVLKGKARLAEAILRNCWQLVIDGELGQLNFYLPTRLVLLLIHAEHFSFHELANLHGCGIDVTQSSGLVSLTGKRNDCESVHEIIIDATIRAREEDVGISTHINGDGNQIFTSGFLEWIDTTYGVHVEKRANKAPKKILYLAENKVGAENARRTLNLALFNTTCPSTPFSTYLPASELASTYSYRPEAHASWFERQKSWFRWAMSSSQNEEAESLDAPFFDKHQTRLSDELLKLLRNSKSPQNNSSNPGQETLSATIGRCLFIQKPSLSNTSISPAQLGKLSLPRIFTNDGILVAQLMSALWPDFPEKKSDSYRLQLIPTSNAQFLPALEIEVAIESQADGEMDILGVKAIKHTNSVDYLLPENGLDLRFTRTISQDLLHQPSLNPRLERSSSPKLPHSPDTQAMLQSIKQSLRDSFAAIESSSSPVPPPTFCNVALPQTIIQQFALKSQLKESKANTSESNVTAEYMFHPLSDIRGALVQKYDFNGRPLHYQYYESGPFLAARTNEVSLFMPISPVAPATGKIDSQKLLDHEFHDFYNAACDMAFKIHANRFVE